MPEFVRWNSQPLDLWAGKYAEGKFIDLDGRRTHHIEKGAGEPVLLLHGFFYDSYQKAISLRHGQEMHRILKGSRLEILDNAGHVPNFERAEEFNQLAVDFLQE